MKTKSILHLRRAILATALGSLASSFFPSGASAQLALDASFGSGGKVITEFGSTTNEQGFAMAVQSDGRILVAGYTNAVGGNLDYDFALMRYNTDGTPDNTFDTDGKVTTVIGNFGDEAKAIAIQADGKILLAGHTYDGTSFNFAIVRYNTNGSLDNTFAGSGILTTDFAGKNDYGMAVAIQSDGKIIVAGRSYNGNNWDFALARYNSNGTLDNTFNSPVGLTTTNIGNDEDYGTSVVIQADGNIIVAGYTFNGAEHDFAAVRYLANGSVDNAFGTNGKVITGFGTGDDNANSVALQSDGKIILAGESSGDFTLARYNSNGTLDNAFGTGGKSVTDFGSSDDDLRSVAIQNDGKLVVAGTTDLYDFTLVRYNSDGSIDNTFGVNGRATTDFISQNDCFGYSVAIQGDGKFIIAGTTHNFTHDDVALARFNATVTGINSFADHSSAVRIYPNPFAHSAHLEISDPHFTQGNLSVHDVLGHEVHSQFLTSSQATIQADLPGGMYFYTVSRQDASGNTREISKGRLLVQ